MADSYVSRRARSIVPERDRIYMKFGSTFVSYRLSTFFVRDLNGPMTAVSGRDPAEQYLPFIDSVYPEKDGMGGRVRGRSGAAQLSDTTGTIAATSIFVARSSDGESSRSRGELHIREADGGTLARAGSDVTPKGTSRSRAKASTTSTSMTRTRRAGRSSTSRTLPIPRTSSP